MNRHSRDYVVLSYLREHAVGPENAKCWREIQQHLRQYSHGNYKREEFQMGFLQYSRQQDFFIASYHKGFYLPGKPDDFGPYLSTTSRRIRGQQANQRAAIRLGRLQEERETSRKPAKPRTRTIARRAGADRPKVTKTPRKARSKGRRSTRS